MDHAELAKIGAIMTISLLAVVLAIVAISIKDKSWINWYTFPCVTTIGTLYVLPVFYMLAFGPTGSTFAYAYSYATYASMNLSVAAGYCFLRPLRIRRGESERVSTLSVLPWALLLSGFFLYLPVLLAFRQFIEQPREIYANFSAAGYGINFFVSAALVSLGFIAYLFKTHKSLIGGCIFTLACAELSYLHGSKGQLLSFVLIGILYRTYVKQKKATFVGASLVIACIVVVNGLVFTIFGSVADQIELVTSMANYSDYSRNAMKVIDDPELPKYHGQLAFEEEFYSRMPRLLVPDKPKAYGQVRLTQRYYPATFRESAGTPAFGIGLEYADFGPAAIFVLSVGSLFTGWLARSIIVSLAARPGLGRFLILLFLSGITLIPLGAGYLLPETLLIAMVFSFFQRHPISLINLKYPLETAPPTP